MSGIFIVVIAAAAMLVGIKFDEKPLFQLTYTEAAKPLLTNELEAIFNNTHKKC